MLDNEALENHRDAIEELNSKYQAALPNVNRKNIRKSYTHL